VESIFHSHVPNVYWDRSRLAWCLRPLTARFPRYYSLGSKEQAALVFSASDGGIDAEQSRFQLRPITYGGVRDDEYPSRDAVFWETETWDSEATLSDLARRIVLQRRQDAPPYHINNNGRCRATPVQCHKLQESERTAKKSASESNAIRFRNTPTHFLWALWTDDAGRDDDALLVDR
jgi:hypothetical protein